MYNGRWTDAYKHMHKHDELIEAITIDKKFPGFKEAPIKHKPTYKCHTKSNADEDYVNKKE
jgi:hypothetical protein